MTRATSHTVLGSRWLALELLNWHAGQGDPLYACGSSWYACQEVPIDVVRDAIRILDCGESEERKLADACRAVLESNGFDADDDSDDDTPTVEAIASAFSVDLDDAQKARGIIDGSIDPEDFESVERWIRQCYHRPGDVELQMAALDEALGGFGVEAIWPPGETAGSCVDPVAEYVNTGDTYSATVLYDHNRGRFLVTTWGDFVEALENAEGGAAC